MNGFIALGNPGRAWGSFLPPSQGLAHGYAIVLRAALPSVRAGFSASSQAELVQVACLLSWLVALRRPSQLRPPCAQMLGELGGSPPVL